MSIHLEPMTRERMHELYRAFVFDPDVFMDMDLYEKAKGYVFDRPKVDALFDQRDAETDSLLFAVMQDDAVIGEVGLRHIDWEAKTCELSIHLQNDAVKNHGYGTRAEQLAVEYAFAQLGMERVQADSIQKNTRSQHVLEKLGFRILFERDGFKCYLLEKKDFK